MALSPRQLVSNLNQTHGYGWVYVAETRSAYNIETGETISRRQLAKQPGGSLAEEGFTSFEAKAKSRRASGLKGYRQTRPGVYEKTITDPRERKRALEALPQQRANVRMLVEGDSPTQRYQNDGRARTVWRHMNFAKHAGKAASMSPEDILSVWDSRASRAGKVVGRPKRWVIRVTLS